MILTQNRPLQKNHDTLEYSTLTNSHMQDYNQNTMPFASASVGKSFRNEISPRSGKFKLCL